jgi:nicotinamidase-related amidase
MVKAVIVVDMLEDFVYGKLKCERALRIIQPLKKLLAEARKKKIHVIYSNDAHLPIDRELEVWGPHGMMGTKEAEVIKDIKPEKGDYVVNKRAYSGFFATDLDMLLRDLKVDTVIIAGLHANICVRHTSADAFFRDYRIIIPEDGVEAFTEKDYKEGLEYLKMAYKAEVKRVDEIINEL